MRMAASPRASTGSDSADRFFIADGTQLRYRDEGSGPAVVLLHGWTLDLEMWEPQVAALRGAFRLVRLDRRGHGQSSGVAASECDALDLAALCRHLELDRVALLGMSQGARGVLGFAATDCARISCLILDGPPDFGSDRTAEEEVPLSDLRADLHELAEQLQPVLRPAEEPMQGSPLEQQSLAEVRMDRQGVVEPGDGLAELGPSLVVPPGRPELLASVKVE